MLWRVSRCCGDERTMKNENSRRASLIRRSFSKRARDSVFPGDIFKELRRAISFLSLIPFTTSAENDFVFCRQIYVVACTSGTTSALFNVGLRDLAVSNIFRLENVACCRSLSHDSSLPAMLVAIVLIEGATYLSRDRAFEEKAFDYLLPRRK